MCVHHHLGSLSAERGSQSFHLFHLVAGPKADIEKRLKGSEVYFFVVVKAGWVLGNLFVVLFFSFFFFVRGGHRGLASTMWMGSSQELCEVLLRWCWGGLP